MKFSESEWVHPTSPYSKIQTIRGTNQKAHFQRIQPYNEV